MKEPLVRYFSGTVDYYRRFRPGIPPEVADVLDNATRRGSPRRLLDIATGTGMVVEALADSFDQIIAIDYDADMLAAAEEGLRPVLPDSTSLSLLDSRAEDFVPPSGWQADLVTICRAFHWLDQATVLERLDAQVAPGGAVAILGDSSFWTADTPWKKAVRDLIKDFLGEVRRAGQGTFQHHDRPYTEILGESAFHQVEEIRIRVRRTWTRESILGYLYSTSFAAPHLFGDRREEFEEALERVLSDYGEDAFPEDNEFLIRIGRREQHRTDSD